ncbi:MAG: hypothetical protein QM691_13150 [Opitutaceae bacterium]
MTRIVRLVAAFAALALGLTASGRPANMEKATSAPPVPTADQAVVEFMRPSKMGGAIKCAVFDITDAEPRLLGILTPKDKLVVAAPAGKRLYMITGENADFMEAELVAGKIFRVIAIARIGAWKARFSLIPLKKHPGEEEWALDGKKAAEWIKICRHVTMTPAAATWYTDNRPSILKKRDAYLPKWNEMNESLKQYRRLVAEDGQ